MTFSEALESMKQYNSVARTDWSGRHKVFIERPSTPYHEPVLVEMGEDGRFRAGWAPSQHDMLQAQWKNWVE